MVNEHQMLINHIIVLVTEPLCSTSTSLKKNTQKTCHAKRAVTTLMAQSVSEIVFKLRDYVF